MTPALDAAFARLAEVARLAPERRAEVLEPLLAHPSAAVRDAAIRVGGAALPVDRLVTYLREGSDAVLRNAGLAMLKARGAEAVPLAVALLQDGDSDVVLQAVLLLDDLRASPPRALEALRRVLRHPNPNVVQAAIVAIGHLGNAGAIGDVAPFLDGDPWVRIAAVQALGDLRSTDAVAPLGRLLADETVGLLAAESLARIGGPAAFAHLAARWLEAPGPDETVLALLVHVLEESAGWLPEPADARLREALRAVLDGRRDGNRFDAARCILALGPSTADSEALTALTAGAERGTLPLCLRRRHDLIGPLLRARGPSREWGLRLAARHPDHTPPDALAMVLAESGRPEHLDALSEAVFAAVGSHRSQLGTALALYYARLPRTARISWTPVLQRHRAAIHRGLGNLAELPDDARVVLAIVTEPAADRAAAMLREAAHEPRIEALNHLLERPDVLRLLPWVRWLEAEPELYGGLAVAAADRGALTGQLETVHRLARERPHKDLIRLLGRLRDRGSVTFLADLVERADGLAPFALAALGIIGGSGARRALRAALAQSVWARFAVRALADCHTPDDLPLFRTLARHADWHVRMVSAEVLGRAGLAPDLPTIALLAADPVPAVADCARRVLDV